MAHEFVAHLAAESGFYHAHHFGSGDTLAIQELPADSLAGQLGIDCRATAVDDDDFVSIKPVLLNGFGDIIQRLLFFLGGAANFDLNTW